MRSFLRMLLTWWRRCARRPDDGTPLYDDLQYEGIFYYAGKPYTGRAVELFPDGTLSCELNFKDGKEHGSVRTWYRAGHLRVEECYEMCIKHGIQREWDESGNLVSEKKFVWGRADSDVSN